MPGHLDVIEIPSADPITVALGGNNDIVIAQLHARWTRGERLFRRPACKRHRRGDPHTGEGLQWKVMRTSRWRHFALSRVTQFVAEEPRGREPKARIATPPTR